MILDLAFSEAEMMAFLKVRYYRLAKLNGAYEVFDGPITETKTEEVIVAFKPKEWEVVADLYWRDEIMEKFGLVEVFKQELKKALLRI